MSSVEVMMSLLNQDSNAQQPINVILNNHISNQVLENRKKLIPIIETVLLCARQNISLRGHRDNGKHLDDETNNPDNFQELLKFKIDSGDEVFEIPFWELFKIGKLSIENHPERNNHVGWKSYPKENSDETKNARFFSMIADEASDTSNTEQMALVIRFVDQNSEIREEFMEFFACDSTGTEYSR